MSSKSNSSGIGFFGLLTILFIGLKLTHYIDWSWWWVLSPLWGPLAIVLGILVLIFVGFILREIVGAFVKNHNQKNFNRDTKLIERVQERLKNREK